jgi:hypothetical protein
LSRISRAFPSSSILDLSLSFNCNRVLLTTPILMSIALMSFLIYVIDFLMFYRGVLSLKVLPVSSIFFSYPSSFSLISVNSPSRVSTFLLTLVNCS